LFIDIILYIAIVSHAAALDFDALGAHKIFNRSSRALCTLGLLKPAEMVGYEMSIFAFGTLHDDNALFVRLFREFMGTTVPAVLYTARECQRESRLDLNVRCFFSI
jgi:hypothetical protein